MWFNYATFDVSLASLENFWMSEKCNSSGYQENRTQEKLYLNVWAWACWRIRILYYIGLGLGLAICEGHKVWGFHIIKYIGHEFTSIPVLVHRCYIKRIFQALLHISIFTYYAYWAICCTHTIYILQATIS